MAAATVTLTLNPYPAGVENTQHLTTLRGTLTLTASSTYTSGGLPITWQIGDQPKVGPGGATPIQVSFFSTGNTPNSYASSLLGGGYQYVWNNANNTFQILAAATVTAGTGPISEELNNGASIPTAVYNDTIQFEAVFVRSFD